MQSIIWYSYVTIHMTTEFCLQHLCGLFDEFIVGVWISDLNIALWEYDSLVGINNFSVHWYDVLPCPSFLSSLFVLSLLNISILRSQNQSISAAHICALRLNEINWRWDVVNQIGAAHVLEEICKDDTLKAVICFWSKENHSSADYSSALFLCLTTNKKLEGNASKTVFEGGSADWLVVMSWYGESLGNNNEY